MILILTDFTSTVSQGKLAARNRWGKKIKTSVDF